MRLTKQTTANLKPPPGKADMLLWDDTLKGFGLRVNAGGRSTWIAQFRVGTKQRRLALGTADKIDADRARKLAKEALSRAQLGEDPAEAKVEAAAVRKVTLRSVLPSFLAWAELRQRAGHHEDVKRYLETHWAPLADLPLAKVDRAMVAARLLEIARERGGFSANRARAALSRFVSWAIGEGVMHDNPVMGTNKPVPEVARDRVLSDDELRLAWTLSGENDFGRVVRLLILSACRREEVAALAWGELDGSAWTIPAERAKNGRAHQLDLPPAAMAVLAGVGRREGRDLAFGSRSGPFSGWSKAKADLDCRMLEALQAERGAKAKLEPWRIHDLRRTAATRMGDLGVQPHIVEAVLNHLSGSKAGVAGVYNRAAYREEKKAALSTWADRVATVVGADRLSSNATE